jgi:dienelactone hydrolase
MPDAAVMQQLAPTGTMRVVIRRIALTAALAICAGAAYGENYIREELRIPMPAAGSRGLETLLVRPDAPGKYPLVIISHGTPRKPEDRAHMTPWTYYPNAIEFARRGWAVAVVMRRGYGGSGGPYAERSGSCDQPDYLHSAQVSAQDIRSAISALARRPDIDGTHVLAVGQSAGGLATVALTADPPPGLIGAISFAGGRGSKSDFVICNEARLIAAFHSFGVKSRTPMLWVYTENDHYFAPPLAAKLHATFTAAGGKAQFIQAPAFGKDGHSLFSLNGIPQWTPYVDNYLGAQKLTQREQPMALPPLPAVIAPPQLSRNGRETFEKYLRAGPHKAFAVSADGHYGWQTAKRTTDEAKKAALEFCRSVAKECRLVFIGDEPAP